MENKIKIIIVDDEVLIREGVELILKQEKNIVVTHKFENGLQLIHHFEKNKFYPDIILLDINMPVLNGVETSIELIKSKVPSKIVFFTNYDSDIFIKRVIEIGASSFLSKKELPEKIFNVIHNTYKDGFYFDDAILKQFDELIFNNENLLPEFLLTEREIEVLKLICLQQNSIEIGIELSISPRTVDGHRNNLLLKTQSKNLAGLVIYAIKNNYFIP